MKQAQHIWSMLDELSDSDPEAYKKFLDKTLQEGIENMAPPKAYMCIHTDMFTPRKEKLYVNIVSWDKIPEPKTNFDPIPVTATDITQITEDNDTFSTIICAFNPSTLDQCCKNSKDQHLLINLALDLVRDKNKVKISRKYELCFDFNFKGDQRLLKNTFSKSEPQEQEGKDVASYMDNPESMLQHLGLSKSEAGMCKVNFEKKMNLEKKSNSSKKLIQEMGNEEKFVEPTYEISIKDVSGKKPRRIVLKISLPEVHSVQECDLNISKVFYSICILIVIIAQYCQVIILMFDYNARTGEQHAHSQEWNPLLIHYDMHIYDDKSYWIFLLFRLLSAILFVHEHWLKMYTET
uniref:PIH1 domain-containing protein 2-like n=1 Tax=Saccoglossus kowalevskii TaxID=10224 RepID=A0ABM0MUB2_SACKO|nr:PREDICTED: PIH1 domain-containing protein 2-like [Saccoglossus kowalevskii]